jgi:hypothetical protein
MDLLRLLRLGWKAKRKERSAKRKQTKSRAHEYSPVSGALVLPLQPGADPPVADSADRSLRTVI